MNKKTKLLFDKFAERPIAYYPVYARICGSVTAGLLLSQLVYWDSKASGNEFYKSDRELQEELSMGRYEVQNAKKRLKHAGFISYIRKKHPATTHYKIDKDFLIDQLTRSDQLAGKRSTTSTLETSKLVVGKPANKLAGNQPTIYKEVHRLPENTHRNKSSTSKKSNDFGSQGKEKNQSQCSYSDGDMENAVFMLSKIKNIQPDVKEPNLESWANDIRLIRERDGRTHEDIRSLFVWANKHNFWRSNILSPAKLRKQWDTLTIQKNSNGNSNGYRSQAEINSASSGQVVL